MQNISTRHVPFSILSEISTPSNLPKKRKKKSLQGFPTASLISGIWDAHKCLIRLYFYSTAELGKWDWAHASHFAI